MKFEVTILGAGAATPTLKRNPTAQVVDCHEKLFLIDCGEGTQVQLRKCTIRFQRIANIFISHLHGDHYLGLPGLISSMHLLGRNTPLNIYSNPDLEELIKQNLRVSETRLNFQLNFIPTDPKKDKALIYEDKTVKVFSIRLKHRVPTTGFLFEEKMRKRKLVKSTIDEFKLTIPEIIALKDGLDITRENGEVLKSIHLTKAPKNTRSYAFCSDTLYFEDLAESIKDVNLLYHESTFLDDMSVRAKETYHSTASQAAKMAQLSNAKELLIGHFSSRYRDEKEFLSQAQAVFHNTKIADQGKTFQVPE